MKIALALTLLSVLNVETDARAPNALRNLATRAGGNILRQGSSRAGQGARAFSTKPAAPAKRSWKAKAVGGLAATGTAAFAYDQVQQRKHAVEAVEMERKLQVTHGLPTNRDGSVSVTPTIAPTPISDMTENQRSLVMGEFASICYNDDMDVATAKAAELGFKRVEFYVYGNAEAYRFTSDHDTVIACRGTETSELSDIITDLKIARVEPKPGSGIPGYVHAGFRGEAEELWTAIRQDILVDPKTQSKSPEQVWFTGHSLGAGIATIMSTFALEDETTFPVAGLVTFGSPRVGNWQFGEHVDTKIDHLRWVNHNDVVTKTPPNLFGRYVHCGKQMYIDENGLVNDGCSWFSAFSDRAATRWQHLGSFSGATDPGVKDHSMTGYVAAVRKALKDEGDN